MKQEDYYSIGQVSKIANLSTKALRYYDKIGLISPDKVEDNQYRFYSMPTLLSVPVIKYYKQMGFKLDEMKSLVEGSTYSTLEKVFRYKIKELKAEERELFIKYKSVKDWYELILEARSVIENGIEEVSVKFQNQEEFTFMNQEFNNNYISSIVNIEFTNFIEKKNNAVTGPVMIYFPSYKDRIEGRAKSIKMVQKTIENHGEKNTIKLGGNLVVSCYHIGSHESINKAYEKITKWVKEKGYRLGDYSIERYVTDYWTTKNTDNFVTEIIIEVKKGME
ncbi:MAG: MerR family transcriptional regulator [Filifactoraceae bacterium]